MFGFYLTITTFLLILSVVLLIMFMNEVVGRKSAGYEKFEFFGMNFQVPEDGPMFIVNVVVFAMICVVVSTGWPLAIPILLYYRRFKRISQSPPSED